MGPTTMKQWLAIQTDKLSRLPTGNSATWSLEGTVGDINRYCILRTDEGVVKKFGHSYGYIEGDFLRLFRSDNEETPWSSGNGNEPTLYSIINLKTLQYETWQIDLRGRLSLMSQGIIIEGANDGP